MKEDLAKYGKNIADTIRRTALGGRIDKFGNLKGTSRIYGYVCAIHEMDDENEELRNTVDVQEFNYDESEYDDQPVGFHEGVLLSAIQGGNKKGVFIVPQLYSEVLIQQDPHTLQEYVIMYSHAKIIQWQSTEEVNIGVTEYEDFKETGDEGIEKDFDELEPNESKLKTNTVYKKDEISDTLEDSDGKLEQKKTAKQKTITVGDTKILIDGQNVTIETSANIKFTVGGSVIDTTDGKVEIKTDTANIEATDITAKGTNITAKGTNITVNGTNVEIKGGNLKTKGQASTDLQGPYNPIKVCPFSGAPHCGSQVSGT